MLLWLFLNILVSIKKKIDILKLDNLSFQAPITKYRQQ